MRSDRSPVPTRLRRFSAVSVCALRLLGVAQPRSQQRHRARAVLVLRALVLALDDDARRQVRDADRRVGLVDVLAAGARRAIGVDLEVGLVDLDLADVLGLGKHGDGARRGVDAALRLGLGHALHAMDAGLELQLRVRALARDARDDLAIAAVLAGIRAQDLDAPALALGVAAVHAEQIAGEDRGFVAARAGAHLEEQVRVVVGILRHEMQEQLPLERGEPPGELLVLVLGERAHVGIGARAQLRGRGEIPLELAMEVEVARDLVEARVLLRQLAEPVLVGDRRRVTEQPRDLFVPLDQLHELGAQRLLHLLAISWAGGSSALLGRNRQAVLVERALDALEQVAAHGAVVARSAPRRARRA